MPSPRIRRTIAAVRVPVTAVTAAGALAVTMILATPTAQTTASDPAVPQPVPVPAVPPLPRTIDLQQPYQGQSICDPVEKPGIKKLKELLRKTYGKRTMYSTRACAADPTSEHTEGRALDWMVSLRVPEERAVAQSFLQWVTADGADGTKAEMARRMGIMYLVWNNQIWRSYDPIGWAPLKSCVSKSMQKKKYDTFCHRDHIHFSLTWDGAAARTSFWDRTPEVIGACPSPGGAGRFTKLKGPFVTVPVRSRSLLDTQTGLGNSGRICRLQEDRWTGDGHRLDVRVAGRKGVPADAQKVILGVTAVEPNAPMKVFVWPTGGKQSAKKVVTTQINSSATAQIKVRLGYRGAISLATRTGDTHLRVTVLGYLKPAGQ